jgi:hypothetical protein
MVRVTDTIFEISAKLVGSGYIDPENIFDFRAARIDDVTRCSNGGEGR